MDTITLKGKHSSHMMFKQRALCLPACLCCQCQGAVEARYLVRE